MSRSVYDNSGPKASHNNFGTFNAEVNHQQQISSPVKNQYEVNYQGGLNQNANYTGSHGSTFGGSGRSYTVSSSSSLGRYPMGMPLGQNQPTLQRGNYSQGAQQQSVGGSLNVNTGVGLNSNLNVNANIPQNNSFGLNVNANNNQYRNY